MDIFSGRENPSWNLSENDSEIFIEKLSRIPETKENASAGAGLGYRGIVITGGLLKDKGFEEIRFYRGVANVKADNRVLNLSDSGRVLELWLIETGAKHIDRDLYESIHNEVECAD
jgi:hypothetical protein